MIEITNSPIRPELVIEKVKTEDSGCVATYVGLIRNNNRGKPVLSVEYTDPDATAKSKLERLASEIRQKWQINNIAFCHRTGKLKVGDINLVIAIASAHRQEALAACQYAIDGFKSVLPTHKRETYKDGSVLTSE